MAGLIYCFNTLGDTKIYKAGHTQNALSMRLKGYLGPSKPRTIIFSRAVDDSVHAEKMMLVLFRQCVSLKSCREFGDEWFEDVSDCTQVLYRHLQNIADIVQLASSHNVMERLPLTPTQPVVVAEKLRGMEQYFTALDKFVHAYALQNELETTENLMNAFETSESCPVFANYLPSERSQRARAIACRYPHLFETRAQLEIVKKKIYN